MEILYDNYKLLYFAWKHLFRTVYKSKLHLPNLTTSQQCWLISKFFHWHI